MTTNFIYHCFAAINKKVDKVIQQLGKLSDASLKSEMSRTSELLTSKSSTSVTRMKEMMKYKIRPIVDLVNANSTMNNKANEMNMIDEVIKEF